MKNIKTAYRPLRYSEVAGQAVTKKILSEEIKRGIHSASYIFCGQYGGGKTTLARIHAMAVNCEKPLPNGDPCCKCSSCTSIIRGENPDIKEIAAAEDNGVSMAKKLAEDITFSPIMAKVKFYILDEAHALSGACWQVLLKVLEEAPEYCCFIICTTEVQKVPLPVRSRSMRCDFYRIQSDDISAQVLKVAESEGHSIALDAAKAIAMLSEGSMRNALGLLEKACAYSAECIGVSDIFAAVGKADPQVYLEILSSLLNADRLGFLNKLSAFSAEMPLDTFIPDIINIVMDMCVLKAGGKVEAWGQYMQTLKNSSSSVPLRKLTQLASLLVSVLNRKETASSIIMAEMLMIFEEMSKKASCSETEEVEMPVSVEEQASEALAEPIEPSLSEQPVCEQEVESEPESKVEVVAPAPTREEAQTQAAQTDDVDAEESELMNNLRLLCDEEPLFRWLLLPVRRAVVKDGALHIVPNPEDRYITKMLSTLIKRHHAGNMIKIYN